VVQLSEFTGQLLVVEGGVEWVVSQLITPALALEVVCLQRAILPPPVNSQMVLVVEGGRGSEGVSYSSLLAIRRHCLDLIQVCRALVVLVQRKAAGGAGATPDRSLLSSRGGQNHAFMAHPWQAAEDAALA
jgi:hypothetical protein